MRKFTRADIGKPVRHAICALVGYFGQVRDVVTDAETGVTLVLVAFEETPTKWVFGHELERGEFTRIWKPEQQ